MHINSSAKLKRYARRTAMLAVSLLSLSTAACVVEPAPGPGAYYDGCCAGYPEYPAYYYGPNVDVGLGYGYGHYGYGHGGWGRGGGWGRR